MTITQHLQQAEQDGLTVTLDPSELSQLNAEIDSWIGMYKLVADRDARVRRVALEARDALRGYDHRSPVSEKITRVCRGEEV